MLARFPNRSDTSNNPGFRRRGNNENGAWSGLALLVQGFASAFCCRSDLWLRRDYVVAALPVIQRYRLTL